MYCNNLPLLCKIYVSLDRVLLLGQLWASESNNKYCTNKVRHTEPNKLGCQGLCEQNANCVGISYTNSGSYTDICYVCFSDTLTSDIDGFNFYRRPGIVLQF